MSMKIRKYLLPNIPYLFVLWFFLKLGTAYRLAAGANFGMKLIGTIQTIGPVMGTITPGLNGFDWLIGIFGAALLRVVVYLKSKKARNSERMWSTVRRDGVRKRT